MSDKSSPPLARTIDIQSSWGLIRLQRDPLSDTDLEVLRTIIGPPPKYEFEDGKLWDSINRLRSTIVSLEFTPANQNHLSQPIFLAVNILDRAELDDTTGKIRLTINPLIAQVITPAMTDKPMARKATIYLHPSTLTILGPRGEDKANLSGRINGIVQRYAGITSDSMPELSLGEWCAICDANNGTGAFELAGTDIDEARHLWANVADSGPDGLGDKWGVDLEALAKKLRAMPMASKAAVYEVVRAFWSSPDLNRLNNEDLLRQAGARIIS